MHTVSSARRIAAAASLAHASSISVYGSRPSLTCTCRSLTSAASAAASGKHAFACALATHRTTTSPLAFTAFSTTACLSRSSSPVTSFRMAVCTKKCSSAVYCVCTSGENSAEHFFPSAPPHTPTGTSATTRLTSPKVNGAGTTIATSA